MEVNFTLKVPHSSCFSSFQNSTSERAPGNQIDVAKLLEATASVLHRKQREGVVRTNRRKIWVNVTSKAPDRTRIRTCSQVDLLHTIVTEGGRFRVLPWMKACVPRFITHNGPSLQRSPREVYTTQLKATQIFGQVMTTF